MLWSLAILPRAQLQAIQRFSAARWGRSGWSLTKDSGGCCNVKWPPRSTASPDSVSGASISGS